MLPLMTLSLSKHMLITLKDIRKYTAKAKESQKNFIIKNWESMNRDEFAERFSSSPMYINSLIEEIKRSGVKLLDKRKKYAK